MSFVLISISVLINQHVCSRIETSIQLLDLASVTYLQTGIVQSVGFITGIQPCVFKKVKIQNTT